jgi:TonB family protein
MFARRFVWIITILAATAITTPVSVSRNRSLQRVRIANDGLVIPNGVVVPPQLAYFSAPQYTDAARDRGIEGAVKVQAEFDIHGGFRVLRILEGLGFGLDEKALEALASWRFLPAMRNGARVGVIAEIEIPFTVDGDLYTRALVEIEQKRFTGGRLLLQTLINVYPESKYLATAKFAIAESFYGQGTDSALSQAAVEYQDFLSFFPSSPLSQDAERKLTEVQRRLGRVKQVK